MDEAPKPGLFPSSSAPQPRDVVIPDFTSDTYAPFKFNLTGDISLVANMGTVWTPVGTNFILRGGYVLAFCTGNLGGVAPSAFLSLFDGDATHPFFPLGVYHPTSTVLGEIVCGEEITTGTRPTAVPWRFDLGKGYRSVAKTNRILMGGLAIGAGTISVQGMLWGIQA